MGPPVPGKRTNLAASLVALHDGLLAVLACVLCVTSQLKIFEVQYLELIYAVDIVVVAIWCSYHSPIRIFRPFFRLGLLWVSFSVVALALAVYALRQDFFMANPTLLKRPFVVTVARVGELALDVFAMVYFAEKFRANLKLRRLACFAFYAMGMAACVYGLASEVGMQVGIYLGGATGTHRMTGFNNEPGPFGAYLIPVIFSAAVLRHQKWISRAHFLIAEAILLL